MDRLSSEDLANELARIEESPWGDWYGRPLGQRGVARMLKSYGIKPHSVRIEDKTAKAYTYADFLDAWGRYLPEAQHPQHPQQPVDSDSSRVADVAANTGRPTMAVSPVEATCRECGHGLSVINEYGLCGPCRLRSSADPEGL